MFWKKPTPQVKEPPFSLHPDGSVSIGGFTFGRESRVEDSEFFGIRVNKIGDYLMLWIRDRLECFYYNGSKWIPMTMEELQAHIRSVAEQVLSDGEAPEEKRERARELLESCATA